MSSASQKAINLPLDFLIPLFLDKPAPILNLFTIKVLFLKFLIIFLTKLSSNLELSS